MLQIQTMRICVCILSVYTVFSLFLMSVTAANNLFDRVCGGSVYPSVSRICKPKRIGAGDRWQGHVPCPPPHKKKKSAKYFSGNYHENSGIFRPPVTVVREELCYFSYTYFRAKMSCLPMLTELLRLYA